MRNRKWMLGLLLAGTLCSTMPAQVVSLQKRGIERAREAIELTSPLGAMSSLGKVYKDTWKLESQDAEARYLESVASAMLGNSDAELKLLHFIEQHPHSSYINHARAALGQLYYARGEYGGAIFWLRQVDTDLLTEEMGAGVEFYHAYALYMEGRSKEALALFDPLTYYPGFKDDALFYAGYLYMREGQLAKGSRLLSQVVRHPLYGPYAQAYLAEVALTESRYSDALNAAKVALRGSSLPREVSLSLHRTAGLASSLLGHTDNAVNYLEQYAREATKPGRVEQLTLGKDLLKLNRYQEAVQYLNDVGNGGSDFMGQLALYYAGLAQLSLKNPSSAIISFDRARSINRYAPITEVSAYNAALAGYAQAPGTLNDGTSRLAQFLTDFPKSEYRYQAIQYLSDAYLNEPNASAVLTEMGKIAPLPKELQKVQDKVKLRRANKSLTSGDASLASQQYDEIIERGSDKESVAEAYLWKGEAAYRSGNYQSAIENTQQYLNNKPNSLPLNPNAYYTIGYAYYNLGKYADAERSFRAYEGAVVTPSPDQKTAVSNRLGDIAMQQRAYDKALTYYSQAQQAGGSEADYALFNKAMIKGLQRNYADKATLLGVLPIQYPQSKLVDEAIYEQGRAYQLAKKPVLAQRVLADFLSKKRNSPFSSKVALQLALSYYATNQLQEAVTAYERVVRHYPNSAEAVSALQDLKSISVQLNRVDSYTQLVKEVGAEDKLSNQELDSLSYLAAEGVVANGTRAEAEEALQQYLKSHPNGAFVDNVHYNMALLRYNAKDYRGTVETLVGRAKGFKGTLAVDAYKLLASSYDKLQEVGRAAEAYYALAMVANNESDRSKWIITSVERAERSVSSDFLQSLVDQLNQGVFTLNEKGKATVYLAHAKSAAMQNNKIAALSSAKRVLSLKDFGGHAIAEIILALDLQDRGDYKGVQKNMLKVTQEGTTDAYWLARAFILLSDSYLAQGDKETARLYLESVKVSYANSSDGILRMIDERLAKL